MDVNDILHSSLTSNNGTIAGLMDASSPSFSQTANSHGGDHLGPDQSMDIFLVLALVNDVARLASYSVQKEAMVLDAFDDSSDDEEGSSNSNVQHNTTSCGPPASTSTQRSAGMFEEMYGYLLSPGAEHYYNSVVTTPADQQHWVTAQYHTHGGPPLAGNHYGERTPKVAPPHLSSAAWERWGETTPVVDHKLRTTQHGGPFMTSSSLSRSPSTGSMCGAAYLNNLHQLHLGSLDNSCSQAQLANVVPGPLCSSQFGAPPPGVFNGPPLGSFSQQQTILEVPMD